MKILITLSSAILVLGVPIAAAQTPSKEQAKEIAELVLKLEYKIKNRITKVAYNKKTDVWRCAQQRGVVHGDLDVEIRDRDRWLAAAFAIPQTEVREKLDRQRLGLGIVGQCDLDVYDLKTMRIC